MAEGVNISCTEIDEVLASVSAHMTAAESHGVLCGLLSFPNELEKASWIAQVLADTEPRGDTAVQCVRALAELFDETKERIADEEFKFELLLPDEKDSLALRAESLGNWCRGYLFGLGLGQASDKALLDESISEFISDMRAIADISAAVEGAEDEEQDFTDLVEYVRIGVLAIREQLLSMKTSETLH